MSIPKDNKCLFYNHVLNQGYLIAHFKRQVMKTGSDIFILVSLCWVLTYSDIDSILSILAYRSQRAVLA